MLRMIALLAFAAAPAPPQVDLPRFMGDWYEIARLPNFPEKGCTDVVVRYALDGDGFTLENTCWKGEDYKVYKGRAVPVPKGQSARFRARFFFLLRSDYWIEAVAEDYSWAAVGGEDRDRLWIISREPKLDEKLYAHILARMKALGYPVEDLLLCEHSGKKPPSEK